ncbi:hypothetical protein DXG01_002629 [Tephrocybe rancida]|nr:hypothetical protein DXG01_002629 [Tephrocybe rancida]
MESVPHIRGRGRGSGQTHSRNRQWVAAENGQRSGSSTPYHSDGERWERGGHRGGHRGRGVPRGRGKYSNVSLHVTPVPQSHVDLEPEILVADEEMDELEDAPNADEGFEEPEEPVLETLEERDRFYNSLAKAREVERKKAIAEGKMDDPSVPKRLEDAITIVGTCTDMCPRFERYRRERENNLFQWETIPGTKRVDHKRAVKMYERAAGDKTLPSDLRPPPVLKRTLDYLFHDLLPRGGFSATYDFIRDRSRSVRNDFTMQHSYGPEAIECHDRCARFHVLALHLGRGIPGFSIPLEEQQLMNTLQSLKEFYEDQRGRYDSPTELEMRVYHRLIHIRDQKERHEDIPEHISSHPVFELTTQFRLHVQRKSAPIHKTSVLKVDAEGMRIFGDLANVLREQGSVVMIYLVACILERLFGKDAIDDIDAIRGDLSLSDIIDGISPSMPAYQEQEDHDDHDEGDEQDEGEENVEEEDEILVLTDDEALATNDPRSHVFGTTTFGGSSASPFGVLPAAPQVPTQLPATSAFSTLQTTPNVFNNASPFGPSVFPLSSTPILGIPATSVFGRPVPSSSQAASSSTTILPTNIFGTGNLSFPTSTPVPSVPLTTAQTTAPSRSVFPSFNGQVETSTATSTSPFAPTAPTPVDSPAAKPLFGQSSIFGKPAPSLLNGAASTATKTPNASVLNTSAAPFMPKGMTPQTQAPTPVITTPFVDTLAGVSGALFHRSSNPSPSPIPFNSNAPPTPAPPSLTPTTPPLAPPSTANIGPPTTQRMFATPPVLPKINTNTSSNPSQQSHSTPMAPPPLPRAQPISLPPTPTLGPPAKTILDYLKGSNATPTTPNQGMLSPLDMSSPATSGLHELPWNRKPPTKGSFEQPAGLLLNINGKGKSLSKPQIDEEELENKSNNFARKSAVVRSCLRRWHQRIVERLAWIEACRQSDAYKQKLKRQRQSPVQSDRKRRISAGPGTVIDSPVKKRLRRRVSSEYHPPRTDEELAQRFKENHEEHERRWAQGSFLKVIANHVKSKNNGVPPHPSWRVWLSMNPESDATAIWLERKFDVPVSGDWASEAVFSIPLTRTADPDSPGIIIFECTPMEGVTDDLERKYRILDDCARLRDIVQAFPPKRHFVPSLLIISWTEGEQAKSMSDFTEMVNDLVENHSIEDIQTFSVTSSTNDLDGKLGEALNALSLDIQGKLVKALNTRGTFKVFEPSFTSFISEWIETCAANGHFNWQIFTQVVQAAIFVINSAVRAVGGLLRPEQQLPAGNGILPAFDSGPVTDTISAYDRITEWLSALGASAGSIAQDLQAYMDIGQDFPAREFFARLWDLAQSQTEILLRLDSRAKVYVPVLDLTAAVQKQDTAFEPHRARLGHTLHLSARRSPVARRRSFTADTETELVGSAKRRRLFSPVDRDSELGDELTPSPYINSDLSPSPTMSNVSLAHSEGSAAPHVVTVAMLRALTRDVKKRYSVPGATS